ncbi:unnamed protein product [Scytosiphon promiscuus]
MAQAIASTRRTANVLIMGTTGAGKSTLGNLLIFGEDAPATGGYKVGDDGDSMTTECVSYVKHESTYTLQVTDTPGVPDTCTAESLANYDKIIEHVRNAPWLNTIIIMVESRRTMKEEYIKMRALMHQFDMLPCAKIMVCRVTLPRNCLPERRREKDAAATRHMEKICHEAKLSNVGRFILHDMDPNEVAILSQMVSAMPTVSMAGQSLRTFEEIKLLYKRLGNAETRMKALEGELKILRVQRVTNQTLMQKLADDLQTEKNNQKAIDTGIAWGGLVAQALADVVAFEAAGAAGAVVQLAALGVRHITKAALAPIARRMLAEKEKAAARVREQAEEIERKEEELQTGRVNHVELQRARVQYEQLCTLSRP